jgi:aspartyl-tRNA synthetase
MSRTIIQDTLKKIGKKVTVSGWVHVRRNMGKIIFIDLRDRSGLLQIVFLPTNKELLKQADELRPEFVVQISGTVQKRVPNAINPKLSTGEIELLAENLAILNTAKTSPFELDKDTFGVNEELRLKYRYLDLRSERMKNNILARSRIIKHLRDYLSKKDFVEIETPILTKGTPEGSREYLVPSRLHAGKFYVLPQSPQQFKQLLMVASLERYFQVARCFRDEDQRGDRQPEFTQVDLEMSFVSEDDVMSVVEGALIKLVAEIYPKKMIKKTPFPRLSYVEAIKKYDSDKPDLREDKNNPDELAFCWIQDPPLFEYSETDKRLVSAHHPFTAPKDEDANFLDKKPEDVKAKAYDIVLNGFEIGGGSIRIHGRDLQNKIFEILGLEQKEISERFGHILEAFEYGAPPHGGLALGIDRLVAILQNEPNIREVIAFPKTGDARDVMMGAPSELPTSQLDEVHIQIKK